jgi:S-adenosylmethionine decarboxylase
MNCRQAETVVVVHDEIFGWDLLLDLYDCDLEKISSREHIERFAIEVCERIRMKRFGEPLIEHFGHAKPMTSGFSLVQLIETSAIVGHFSEHRRAAYLDLFSCQHFDADDVAQFAQDFFGAQRMVQRMMERR